MALRKEAFVLRLVELRERAELTQERAAALVPVSVRTWQRWEAGEAFPFPSTLGRIAEVFGVKVDSFFGEGDPEPVDSLGVQVAALMARVQLLEALEQELREGARKRHPLDGSTVPDEPGRPDPAPGR